MKSMLYIGATLMAGACIYGFADYKKTNRSREFQSLYSSEQPAKTEKAVANTTENKEEKVASKLTGTAVKANKATSTVKHKAKRKLSYKKFSRAPLKEVEEVK